MRMLMPIVGMLLVSSNGYLLSEGASPSTNDVKIESPAADLVDKATILEIKLERISDVEKRINIEQEYRALMEVYKQAMPESKDLEDLHSELLNVNKNLWDLEDATREKERSKNFDDEFALQVLEIINNNDNRARIKRTINELVGSHIIEQKSYTDIMANQTKQKFAAQSSVSLVIPVPLGELIDRYVILEIKERNIDDESKRAHIQKELRIYEKMIETLLDPDQEEFVELKTKLFQANKEMWDIQNKLREKRVSRLLDEEFKELGRGVYYTNDKRCRVKRQINELFGSQLIEEKCYAAY